MKAIWNGKVIAESDGTVVVEHNHYFPHSSLNMEYFYPSDTKLRCYCKGEANYYTVAVAGMESVDAAWFLS